MNKKAEYSQLNQLAPPGYSPGKNKSQKDNDLSSFFNKARQNHKGPDIGNKMEKDIERQDIRNELMGEVRGEVKSETERELMKRLIGDAVNNSSNVASDANITSLVNSGPFGDPKMELTKYDPSQIGEDINMYDEIAMSPLQKLTAGPVTDKYKSDLLRANGVMGMMNAGYTPQGIEMHLDRPFGGLDVTREQNEGLIQSLVGPPKEEPGFFSTPAGLATAGGLALGGGALAAYLAYRSTQGGKKKKNRQGEEIE